MESFEISAFYRGMSADYDCERPLLLRTRKDREPRNTDKVVHQRADAWFEQRFGIRYRSQALLVTSSIFTAKLYAATARHVFRVIPLGPYKYCWSAKVRDMVSLSTAGGTIEDMLYASCYIESDLTQAHDSGNEVMLYCEEYVAIPSHLLGDLDVEPAHETSVIISA